MNTRPFNGERYIKFKNTSFMFLNDDNPQAAYDTSDLTFVAQPLSHNNQKYNVVVVPLMMTDMWNIINDHPDFIESLRNTEKKYDFCFIGGCRHAGREVFRELPIERYLFRETTDSIYYIPPDQQEKKHKTIMNFLHELSMCKFIFAPRGTGSSSFRLYEAMSVGSVPIITGQPEMPFSSNVDWDKMSLSGDLKDINKLVSDAQHMSDNDYHEMRSNAICFWDNYCQHDQLYNKLEQQYDNI